MINCKIKSRKFTYKITKFKGIKIKGFIIAHYWVGRVISVGEREMPEGVMSVSY